MGLPSPKTYLCGWMHAHVALLGSIYYLITQGINKIVCCKIKVRIGSGGMELSPQNKNGAIEEALTCRMLIFLVFK